ncbi:MAG: M48 family metallopeptidase [Chitinophagales bacterium]|nr:M48 family metallopeptidase [Chitinophagales bacterium]
MTKLNSDPFLSMLSPLKKPVAEDFIEAGGKKFKLFIYLENRNNCAASIGKKGVHIRLSKYLSKQQRQKEYFSLKNWAHKYIIDNKLFDTPVTHRKYDDGDIFSVQGKEYLIRIVYHDKNTSKGSLKNGVIQLTLSKSMHVREEQKHKSYLISRLLGNEFQPVITQRLEYLNALHFKKEIKKVRMRYNVSNWGSCSHDGNISISTGLLFAPAEVIDYILIHELAHLVEHNHSARFWKLVEHALPAYQVYEKWLDANAKKCFF